MQGASTNKRYSRQPANSTETTDEGFQPEFTIHVVSTTETFFCSRAGSAVHCLHSALSEADVSCEQ